MNRLRITTWLLAGALCLAPLAGRGWAVESPVPPPAGQAELKDPLGQKPGFERGEKLPDEFEGVGVTEHLGESVPLDIPFTDENSKSVTLGDYFKDGKPVILDLGYYSCPMLCGLVLNGLQDAIRGSSFTPGKQFRVVNVSIDPTETPELAMAKKRNAIADLGNPEASAGWHFLTGREADIQRLTRAVGFNYRYNERERQYAHSAVLTLLTPDGKVSRYLYGVQYPATTLRLSLVEASEGKIGSTVDQILLTCSLFDPSKGKYTLAVLGLMKIAGVVTVLLLAGVIGLMLWRESRRHQAPASAESSKS